MNKLQEEIEKELSLTNPDVSKLEDFIYLLQEENDKLKSVLKLANTIIDELIEVAEVHVDDTFEKINELNKLQGK